MKRILIICSIVLIGLIAGSILMGMRQKQSNYQGTESAEEFGYMPINTSTGMDVGLTDDPQKRLEPTGTQPPDQSVLEMPTPSADVVSEMLIQINRDRVLSDLRKLTGEEPICTQSGCYTIKNRETGSEGLQRAKDYVYEELVRLKYSVELRDWSHSGYTDQNLVARKRGTIFPDQEIYFVAHLDGYVPDGTEASPAADDNATGAVAVLELARVLSRHTFGSTMVLLFSTGEEHGVLGVRSYVDQLSAQELGAIRYVVNVEMLGYDSDNDGVMQLWSGDHLPSQRFAEVLSGIISRYQLGLVPHIISGCA